MFYLDFFTLKPVAFEKAKQSIIQIMLALFASQFNLFFHSNCIPIPHLSMHYAKIWGHSEVLKK